MALSELLPVHDLFRDPREFYTAEKEFYLKAWVTTTEPEETTTEVIEGDSTPKLLTGFAGLTILALSLKL